SSEVSSLGTSNDVTFNFFNLPVSVAANDFITLDESQLTAPRQPDGSLPYVNFARLTNTSDCIDKGTKLGFAFYGVAPDLGAFEFGPTNGPSLAVATSGTTLVISANGWANRTNYLLTSTNPSLPTSLWTRIATNKSDLMGTSWFTNSVAEGA